MDHLPTREQVERLDAELETLQRWYEELATYLESGLQNKSVSHADFSNAATMSTRVLIRLKTLYDKLG